jgi:hypothetical protein
MCAFNAFVKKRLIPSVKRVGLKAFEALDIEFVNQSLNGLHRVEVDLPDLLIDWSLD